MLKCLVFVLCTLTIVFCAPGHDNLREKQSSRQEQVTDRLNASRTKRQSLGKVDIVYLDAESIDPSKLKDLQSKESSRLTPVNDVINTGQNFQGLSDSNLEIVSQSSNYIVYKLKSTGDSPLNSLPDDKRTLASDNQYYNDDTGLHSGYSDGRNQPPPPPPYYHPPPPPRDEKPPHHHYPPPPSDHYPPPPPPPHHRHHPPPPPPPHHDHPPPPYDYYRSSYYDRPPPPPPPRSSYDDRSRRFYDDRQTRQSSYDRPPPPHRGGPPPHHGGPPPRDRGPPPRDGGRPPRYDEPPHHFGGPPPRDGPPDRYDRGPPPPPGGQPDRYDHRPPPHHGGPPDRFDNRPPPPPDRYDHRPPPHHGGPPDRFDNRPPPPPDRYDDRGPPPRGGPPDRYDNRPPYDRRPPPPPDRDQYDNQGNGNNEYSQNYDHSGKLTDVTWTSSTTEAVIDDNQYQLDVRFMDDEQKPVEDLKRDVAVTTTLPLSPFIFQAAAVTPED